MTVNRPNGRDFKGSSRCEPDAEGQFEDIFEKCQVCKHFFDVFQMRVTQEGDFVCDECLKILDIESTKD